MYSNHNIQEQNVRKALWLQLEFDIYSTQITPLTKNPNLIMKTAFQWHNDIITIFLMERWESV